MIREAVAVFLDSVVGGLHISGFEGRLPNNQCVNDNTERPNVYLVRVTRLALKHLWRNVVRCAANRAFPLSFEVNLGCKAEVSDLDLHLLVDE